MFLCRRLRLAQVTRKKPREELSSEAGAAAARLSKRLVVIRTDIDLPPLRCAKNSAQTLSVQALMLLSGLSAGSSCLAVLRSGFDR